MVQPAPTTMCAEAALRQQGQLIDSAAFVVSRRKERCAGGGHGAPNLGLADGSADTAPGIVQSLTSSLFVGEAHLIPTVECADAAISCQVLVCPSVRGGGKRSQVGMLSYAPQLARAPSWLSPRRQRPRTCNTEHQRCATWKNTADPQTQCGPREGISFQSATLATNKCTKTWRHLPPVSRTILPRDVVAAHLGSTSGAAQGTPLRAHDASMAW